MKEVTLMTQLSLESPNRQELMQDFESLVLISTQIYSTTIVMEYDRNHEIGGGSTILYIYIDIHHCT